MFSALANLFDCTFTTAVNHFYCQPHPHHLHSHRHRHQSIWKLLGNCVLGILHCFNILTSIVYCHVQTKRFFFFEFSSNLDASVLLRLFFSSPRSPSPLLPTFPPPALPVNVILVVAPEIISEPQLLCLQPFLLPL